MHWFEGAGSACSSGPGLFDPRTIWDGRFLLPLDSESLLLLCVLGGGYGKLGGPSKLG